jgi:hypothetical protein
MDFVKESINQTISDWTKWTDTYVYKKSELYKQIHQINEYFGCNSKIVTEMFVLSPFQIWIDMMKSPNIKLEQVDITSCCIPKSDYRYNVVLDNKIIAVIDKLGESYKYVSIPCIGDVMSQYLQQFQ